MSDGNGVLPSLPNSWSWADFRDIASIDSKLVPPADFPNHPHIAPDNIGKGTGRLLDYRTIAEDGVTSNKNHFFPGQIVYSKIRPYLSKVIVADFAGLCSADMYPVSTPLELRYLFRYMLSDFFLAAVQNQAGNRVVLPEVNQKQLYDVPVPVAPEAEQRRIVSKIESLQERSSRARRALSEVGPLLEQFRQSVLRAAFSGRLTADWRAARSMGARPVDQDDNSTTSFERPADAHGPGAHATFETATELLSRIRAERRHRWEQSELAKYEAKGKKPPKNWQDKYKEPESVDESGLPSLPDGWCWTSLGQLTLIDSGEAFKKKDYSESGIRLFQIANVSFGRTLWDQKNFLPEQFAESHGFLLLENTDMAIALNRPILNGRLKVTRLTDDDLPAILYQRVGRIRTAIPEIADYLFGFMRSPSMLKQVEDNLQGTDQPYINTSDMPRIVLPLAPLEEQAEIVRLFNEMLESVKEQLVVVAESESALTQLDQSILAKAFRGELVPQDHPRDERPPNS